MVSFLCDSVVSRCPPVTSCIGQRTFSGVLPAAKLSQLSTSSGSTHQTHPLYPTPLVCSRWPRAGACVV
ncbi:hypothetical protein Q7C36_012839 [Tachysurus vachellii]|uniref:Uncharacterized protein n=1 Tax=Tachysurus vachellii TaxID=175792 RepID=A0AA88SKR2_TACVA|nr:hypothetical protein Q7C36_012839 [Tachysurus vachellii]